jgi:Helix-turn-helix domain
VDPLLTTAQVAEHLAMSPDWVRDHSGELGGIRAGRTVRAPLRFERESIEAWKRRQRVAPPQPEPRPRARRAAPPGVELLPLPPEVELLPTPPRELLFTD